MSPLAEPHSTALFIVPDDLPALPFGITVPDAVSPSAREAGRFGWTAQDFDATTGLQYNLTRYYCEAPGMWTSEKPPGLTLPNLDRDRPSAVPLGDR